MLKWSHHLSESSSTRTREFAVRTWIQSYNKHYSTIYYIVFACSSAPVGGCQCNSSASSASHGECIGCWELCQKAF